MLIITTLTLKFLSLLSSSLLLFLLLLASRIAVVSSSRGQEFISLSFVTCDHIREILQIAVIFEF